MKTVYLVLLFVYFLTGALPIITANYSVNYSHKSNTTYQSVCPKPLLRSLNTKTVINQVVGCFQEFAKYQRVSKQPDHGLRTDQVIQNHGYYLVTYNNITSSDGYIQTMFRITGSPKSPPRKGKESVLMLHGLCVSSSTFVLLGNISLPFVLADAGYEVWLPNFRGTDYSDRHLRLNAYRDLKYWKFTFHEIAVIDLPVYINLILSETGRNKLFTFSHSLGGAIITAALAENPELNNKIYANFMYGPTIIINEVTQFSILATKMTNLSPEVWEYLLDSVFLGNLALGHWFLNQAYTKLCSGSRTGCGFCAFGLTLIGYNHDQFNASQTADWVGRLVNTMSLRIMLHLHQNIRKCSFDKYDYGTLKNFKLYGQENPPSYNLKNVKAPVHIYYGATDKRVSVRGQMEFVRSLPPGTVKGFHRVPVDEFDHTDVILNKDAYKFVYLPMINDMKKYSTINE